MGNTLHLLGVAHTVPHEDYLVCAFTAKVLLFPEVIQPFGWHVVEYSNEGSASQAREHVVILTEDRLRALSRRTSRDEPLDADANNTELRQEFQSVLLEKIRSRASPGDIVCHVWGPNMEVYNLLPNCRHIEICVGYTASPGLPFRVYETSAWMHWHYGKAGQEDGNNYKWVIPSPIDVDKWAFREEPDDYAIFLGRVAARKGIDTLVEIAGRMPELPIHVYGPGDPSQWAKHALPNLLFKGPVFGEERFDVVRRARCMLMPTVFIEPFGNSGVEAQLCGVPLIGVSYGAFQETILDGVTGYRCHTLADWVEAIRLSGSLDRRQIATLAREKYSKKAVGKKFDSALRQLVDLSGRGWYGDTSRKFASPEVPAQAAGPRKRRIWLYMPYFGAFPNYFQLYLDSLGRNADCLSVFLLTDIDLSGYRVPENLAPIPMTLDALRERAARFINEEFNVDVRPDALLKQPYKLNDFRIMYLELFRDISDRYGVTEDDFVGWGDCDLIYGRFSDFLDMDEDYQIIGGYHGHLTALRNIEPFRKLFREVADLPELLVDEKCLTVDEIAFRKPLLEFLGRNQYEMFYTNRYFCDIVPECFFGLFRSDHARRAKNFFDGYNPDKDIDHLHYDRDGRLTVTYDNGISRPSLYCHLQKRAMSIDFDRCENGYYIGEDAFRLVLHGDPKMDEIAPAIADYLWAPAPHKLEIGAGPNGKPGWLATDLNASVAANGTLIVAMDATKPFPIPDDSFDFIFTEHMIEHISFDDGLNMLSECYRVLKPNGVLRVVTPSLGFLLKIVSSDRGALEERYREWSITTCDVYPPAVTNAVFINNFMRAWGHTFIYDHETLRLALTLAGFREISPLDLNASAYEPLRNLEAEHRLPPGYLKLESMVFEAVKGPAEARSAHSGRNLALGRRATQSSVSPWSRAPTPEEDASRVVSGVWTNSYNCHTALEERPWWRVDLGSVCRIQEVRIYNRLATLAMMQRTNRFEIHVSDDDATWRTVFRKDDDTSVHGRRQTPFIWTPEQEIRARFLRIQLLGRTYLHLEQLEVFGENETTASE